MSKIYLKKVNLIGYKTFSKSATVELQKNLKWFYVTDRVYNQNNDVGDSINNYLKLCKQGL